MGALGAGTVVQKEKENETHDRGGPLFKPARRGRARRDGRAEIAICTMRFDWSVHPETPYSQVLFDGRLTVELRSYYVPRHVGRSALHFMPSFAKITRGQTTASCKAPQR